MILMPDLITDKYLGSNHYIRVVHGSLFLDQGRIQEFILGGAKPRSPIES